MTYQLSSVAALVGSDKLSKITGCRYNLCPNVDFAFRIVHALARKVRVKLRGGAVCGQSFDRQHAERFCVENTLTARKI